MIFDKFINKRIQKYIANNVSKALATTDSDELYRMLYPFLSTGLKLTRDTSQLQYIERGYEGNVDVFSIISKVSTMFARVPYLRLKGENETDADPIAEIFGEDSADYSWYEFRRNWMAFGMASGNSIVYHLEPQGGTNQGRVKFMRMLPTQHVEIESGGILDPIGKYTLNDLGTDRSLDPAQIWHTRLFDNLDYRNGKNFMGISPIKVAANIINAQNFGYELISTSAQMGMPPTMIYPKGQNFTPDMIPEQQRRVESAYIEKYKGKDRKGVPLFAPFEFGAHTLGFSNLRDLMLVESSQEGRRVLCNIWGVPAELFNDKESSTYNNMEAAYKAVYTNRIIPDADLFFQGLNRLIKPTGIVYKPDWAQIDELQDDKEKLAKILDIGVRNNSITLNEFREGLGYDEDPAVEGMRYSDMNIPNQFLNGLGQPQ